jgi:HEPN domain-containing protein
MSAHARSLIIKASENLEVAKKHLDDEKQHDMVGYNLAQACEQFLKALCEMRGLDYPSDDTGHDLDTLMQVLEENNFSAISSHADIIELTEYNSPKAYIKKEDRLNLNEYLEYVESLKSLVGDQFKLL